MITWTRVEIVLPRSAHLPTDLVCKELSCRCRQPHFIPSLPAAPRYGRTASTVGHLLESSICMRDCLEKCNAHEVSYELGLFQANFLSSRSLVGTSYFTYMSYTVFALVSSPWKTSAQKFPMPYVDALLPLQDPGTVYRLRSRPLSLHAPAYNIPKVGTSIQ